MRGGDESEWTKTTFVGSFAGVGATVDGQVGAVGEAPIAEVALVRLGVGVLLLVNPKCVTVRKFPRALVTSEKKSDT